MKNNITIVTADDITTPSDGVNIYPVELSGTLNTLSNALNWLEKCSYFTLSNALNWLAKCCNFRPIFCSVCCVILRTHP